MVVSVLQMQCILRRRSLLKMMGLACIMLMASGWRNCPLAPDDHYRHNVGEDTADAI